jgi:hypothetical protein
MEQAMSLATMMAKAGFLARELQTQGGALFVIEQAMRWNMSPFAVAMETSFIQGKPMFSGKIVSAAVTSSGAIMGRLSYEYAGAGETRQVTVSGIVRGEDEPRSVVVILKDARTGNKVWNTQPDQQLAYHGARVWARRHTPEVMLGVLAPEEMEEAPAPLPPTHGPTITGHAAPMPDIALTMLTPNGETRDAPNIATWVRWCEAAIGKLEDAPAVSGWLQAMRPHFLVASSIDDSAVAHIESRADQRFPTQPETIEGEAA